VEHAIFAYLQPTVPGVSKALLAALAKIDAQVVAVVPRVYASATQARGDHGNTIITQTSRAYSHYCRAPIWVVSYGGAGNDFHHTSSGNPDDVGASGEFEQYLNSICVESWGAGRLWSKKREARKHFFIHTLKRCYRIEAIAIRQGSFADHYANFDQKDHRGQNRGR